MTTDTTLTSDYSATNTKSTSGHGNTFSCSLSPAFSGSPSACRSSLLVALSCCTVSVSFDQRCRSWITDFKSIQFPLLNGLFGISFLSKQGCTFATVSDPSFFAPRPSLSVPEGSGGQGPGREYQRISGSLEVFGPGGFEVLRFGRIHFQDLRFDLFLCLIAEPVRRFQSQIRFEFVEFLLPLENQPKRIPPILVPLDGRSSEIFYLKLYMRTAVEERKSRQRAGAPESGS